MNQPVSDGAGVAAHAPEGRIQDLEALQSCPLFQDLPAAELEALLEGGERIALPSGTFLLEEGTPGDLFYQILRGELEVSRTENGRTTVLDIQGPGGFLSEMSLVEDRPRCASARATRDSEVLGLDPDDFRDLLHRRPGVALSMLQIVMRRLRSTETSLIAQGRMAGLGTLAAGLAHELNNPAAAIARNGDLLRPALQLWHQRGEELRRLDLQPPEVATVDSLKESVFQANVGDRGGTGSRLLEAELEAWLETRGVSDAWQMAPVLSEAGWTPAGLEALEEGLPPHHLPPVVRWLAAGLDTFGLVEGIRNASEAISDIVSRVRAYSALDRGPVQCVDLKESLTNALSIMRGRVGPNVRLRMELDEDLPTLEGHGGLLGQVWSNLIQNALDAMGSEGTLKIRARGGEEEVAVEISDDGPGIPESVRPRIFDPFFTTKPQGKGTGLGLAISYGIVVNQHRGTIGVKSLPGETVFEVVLPRRRAQDPEG